MPNVAAYCIAQRFTGPYSTPYMNKWCRMNITLVVFEWILFSFNKLRENDKTCKELYFSFILLEHLLLKFYNRIEQFHISPGRFHL